MRGRITLRLHVSPYESAARFAVAATPEGYELESMSRTPSEAVCVYRCVVVEASKPANEVSESSVEAANPGAAKPEEGAK